MYVIIKWKPIKPCACFSWVTPSNGTPNDAHIYYIYKIKTMCICVNIRHSTITQDFTQTPTLTYMLSTKTRASKCDGKYILWSAHTCNFGPIFVTRIICFLSLQLTYAISNTQLHRQNGIHLHHKKKHTLKHTIQPGCHGRTPHNHTQHLM